MTRMRLPLIAAAVLAAAAPAAAQQVALSMQNGLVTLNATNAPVRQIMAEWARVGRVAVINGEKVAGAPVTLQLAGVSERQALDTILRGVAGYMVSARAGTPDAAQARFDKVIILPTSAAPANPPPAPASMAGRQPLFQPGPQIPDPDDGFNEDPDLPGAQTPAFQPGAATTLPRPIPGNVTPMPGPGPQFPQGALPRYQTPTSGYPPSMVTPQTGPTGRMPVPGGQVTPATPFGTMPGGAPGAIAPTPQSVPLSPTNPGIPSPSGAGPATR
ncbi:MAG: hypothetical protein AB7P67_09775 [Vicinamibacterales bacterium]